MPNITLNLTDKEAHLILKALSRLPFGEVYHLIEKIVKAGEASQYTGSAGLKDKRTAAAIDAFANEIIAAEKKVKRTKTSTSVKKKAVKKK